MHVEDAPPALSVFSAHGCPMSGNVLLGRINPEIVGVPEGVAEAVYIARAGLIARLASRLEIALAQVMHDLLASPVLAMLSVENDFRIEALLHRFCVSVIEGDVARPQIH